MTIHSVASCSCAERTGELVVITCPVCCGKALVALRSLTNTYTEVRLDEEGSVSGLELEREPYGQK